MSKLLGIIAIAMALCFVGCGKDPGKVVEAENGDGVQLWENGPYWAECNVGASKAEEFGYYFWWGGAVGYSYNDGRWISVEYGERICFIDSGIAASTYRKDRSELRSAGYIDSIGNLAPSHDAATVHLGSTWRMPTKAEFEALASHCTTTWTNRSGVCGRLVTGKGDYRNKSIFLPAAGYGGKQFDGTPYLFGLGEKGCYWSSMPDCPHSDDSRYACCLYFSSGDVFGLNYGGSCGERYSGRSVRPVREFLKKAKNQAAGEVHCVAEDLRKNNLGFIRCKDGRVKVQLWEGGPYWATTNIGAEEPWEFGYHFRWGDTVGYKREDDKWVASDGSVPNFSFDREGTPTHGWSISTLMRNGWVTVNGALVPKYDAAQAYWGGDWRMPTKAELGALIKNCDWVQTEIKGVNGCVVRGKGDYASNYIFLSYSGVGKDTWLGGAGSEGQYLSSVPFADDQVWVLNFSDKVNFWHYGSRGLGCSIRPVQGFAISRSKDVLRSFLDACESSKYDIAAELIGEVDKTNVDVQLRLGQMYANGWGVTQDVDEAVKWFRKSAEQGNLTAQLSLANMYIEGRGVTKDDYEAVRWIRKAAEQGDASAQNCLGLMYQNGRGVTKDDDEAVKWFRKAAAQGEENAKKELKNRGYSE